MGFLSWLFPSRQREARQADVELLKVLMLGQTEASTQRTALEMKRQELEIRRMELEFENLERVGEERRRERDAAQKLREQRREWSAKARAAIRTKNAQAVVGGSGECRVCRNPGDPTLTANEIAWHHGGHRAVQ
jgi:hypothetical protein